ncbi:MAG: hypothetical protein ACTSUY_08435 [Alphaproteobacteria bacterium]
MARVKIRYYVVKNGRAFWQPTKRMRQLGFDAVPLGVEGPEAWKRAHELNERWLRVRRGEAPPAGYNYPPHTLGNIFLRYRQTHAWKAKAPTTRLEWERRTWPHIEPVFADVDVSTVTFEACDAFYAALVETLPLREAHRVMKILRAMFEVAKAFGEISDNPTAGIRNKAPAPRSARWREGEAVRLVKTAWRTGYRGLGCVVAVAWDTQFSPVDVRCLTPAHSRVDETGPFFEVSRTKTGAAALGTISRRTQRLIEAYLGEMGAEFLPDAPLFRNRSGGAYSKDKLAADFRNLRVMVFGPSEMRQLADMRRSGAMEAVAGGVNPGHLSAKMGNTIATANHLWRTYAPADTTAVRQADEARRRGRRLAKKNETG